jgi:hypothetical protein
MQYHHVALLYKNDSFNNFIPGRRDDNCYWFFFMMKVEGPAYSERYAIKKEDY